MAEHAESEVMAHCPDCGRLFLRKPGMDVCSRCLPYNEAPPSVSSPQEKESLVHALSERLGLRPEAILEAMRDTEPDWVPEELEPVTCTLCGQRPALEGSEFCLECRMTRYRSIGDAAQAVKSRGEQAPQPMASKSPSRVRDALAEKRARTAASRIDTTGGQALKRYT